METTRTNKQLLSKGLKTMGVTLFLMFLGPTTLHIGFSNPEKPLYIPLVVAGIFICFLAIYYGFKGIQIIMKSMFGSK
jgi:hypothetical protein